MFENSFILIRHNKNKLNYNKWLKKFIDMWKRCGIMYLLLWSVSINNFGTNKIVFSDMPFIRTG